MKRATRREFVWANTGFFLEACAVLESQIATSQESFCGSVPLETERWGRVLPEDDARTPKCAECRERVRGWTCANRVVDRAVAREDARRERRARGARRGAGS